MLEAEGECAAVGREAEIGKPESGALGRTRDVIWRLQGFGLILLTFLSFFPRLFHLEEYLFFALLLIAAGTSWLDGKGIWVRTPIDLPLLLFAGWVLLTIPFATDPAYSFAEWRKFVTQVLVFYWVCLVWREQPEGPATRAVLTTVVLGTAILCGYALIDFVERGGSWKDRYVRAAAPSSDFNWLSTYLVIAIPLVVSFGVNLRAWWQRVSCGGVVGLALLAQVFSYTRAGWLGLVAQGIAVGLIIRRRWVILAILLGCLFFGLGFWALSVTGYQYQTVSLNTFYYRLEVWKLIADEIAAHPLVGIGYGDKTYMMRFGDYPASRNAGGSHSLFLMVALGSGIPALALLIWTLVSAVRSFLGWAGQGSDGARYALMVGTVVMIVGFVVRNSFDYMFAGSLAYLFWIVVATSLSEGMAEMSLRMKRGRLSRTGSLSG